jgi:hypothetical protein
MVVDIGMMYFFTGPTNTESSLSRGASYGMSMSVGHKLPLTPRGKGPQNPIQTCAGLLVLVLDWGFQTEGPLPDDDTATLCD